MTSRGGPEARTGIYATAVKALKDSWAADRWGTVLAGSLQVIAALTGLGVVYASKIALDALLANRGLTEGVVGGLLLLSAVTAVSGAVVQVQAQRQRLLGERVAQHLWNRLLETCARADLAKWNDHHFMARLDRVRDNALGRPTAVVGALFALVGGLLSVLALTTALAELQPLLVPVLLLAGLPSLAVSRLASRSEFAFAERSNPTARTRLYLKQVLTGRSFAAEVRAFEAAEELLSRHHTTDTNYVQQLRRQVQRRERLGLISTGVSSITLAVAFLMIVWLVDAGRMSLADAGAAAIAARLLGSQLATAFAAVGSLIESRPFLVDMASFNAQQSEPLAVGTPRPQRGELRLQSIGFRYAADAPDVLDDVDLMIRPGEVVALVGENGSGKSTLAKIAAGLYEASRGSVTWDGNPIPRLDLTASVSVLFQDFVRYQMTARENITLARPRLAADEQMVRDAAARAAILDALDQLPAGLSTQVGLELGEGTDLSGGQWQRLALARAFYRDSPLIVMDEPTAAMDPKAEHDLFADVRKVLHGKSALLISHRFSSVRLADRIYVLEGGRVVESGTHDELMSSATGRYAEMYTLQAAAYL